MNWLIRASRSNTLSWPTRRGGNCRHRLLPCLIVSARCAHLLNLCIQLRPNIPIAPAMPQQFLHRPSAYFPHAFGCVAGRNIPIPIPMLLPPASGTQEASPAPCLVSGPSQGSGPPPPLPMHCPNPRLQHLPPFSPNIPCPDSSYLIPTFSSLRSEFSPRAPSQRPFRCQRSQQRHTFLPSIPFSFSPAVDAASTPSCPLFRVTTRISEEHLNL